MRSLLSTYCIPFLIVITVLLTNFGCKQPKPRLPISNQTGTFLKQSSERNKQLFEFQKSKIETLIKRHPNKTYLTSKHGFWYTYNKKNKNDVKKASFGTIINFDFDIFSLNGDEIYPKKNLNYIMDKEELFKGLREGLKLMKPNEEVTFIFPSHIAYGYYGDDNKIGTNMPIICNVTLNSIIKNND